MEYIVLGIQKWNLEDEKTKQQKRGITVHFFDAAEQYDDPGIKGVLPAKISVDERFYNDFTVLPGKYNIVTKMSRGAGGRSKSSVVSIEFSGGLKEGVTA